MLLAEEVLNAGSITEIVEALGRQPAWSDIPIVLISSVGNASRERLRRLASFGSGGTVTLLERPFRPGTLVATIEAALRARYRQYQVCRLLAEVQENARRSQLISETAAQLLLADSPQAEVPGIFQRLADELGAEYHLLHLLSPDGKVLVLAGAGGSGRPRAFSRAQARGRALRGAGRAAPTAAFAAWAAAARVKAWNCQVLQVGERMLGTIVFASARRESLTAEELRAVRTICDLVAASLERMRLLEELGAARDAAERANRSKDDFLAALSHELRTPLSPVLLVATAAVNNPNLALAVRGDFELISRHIALEARLIDDLLDLTGITRGKLTLELRPLKLHEVLREAAATAETELRAKDIALRLEFAAEPAVISADPVRVRQVFWNVIKNAVKFTPPQGSILVTTERTSGGRSVRITIADTGVGMTPEEIERAFDAFSQGDHARSPSGHRFGGLGLGLAISRALVGLHGGTISARSAGRGRGSTFTVELPLVPAASAVAAAAEPVPDQPIGAARPGAHPFGRGPRAHPPNPRPAPRPAGLSDGLRRHDRRGRGAGGRRQLRFAHLGPGSAGWERVRPHGPTPRTAGDQGHRPLRVRHGRRPEPEQEIRLRGALGEAGIHAIARRRRVPGAGIDRGVSRPPGAAGAEPAGAGRGRGRPARERAGVSSGPAGYGVVRLFVTSFTPETPAASFTAADF